MVRKEDSDLIRRVRDAAPTIDGGFSELIPFEVFIQKSLYGIPVLKWGMYLPEPIISAMNWHPWSEYSITLPSVYPFPKWIMYDLGHESLLFRATHNLFHRLMYYNIAVVSYGRWRFNSDSDRVKADYERLMEDVMVGDGFNGMRELKQDPPNLDSVIPPFRSSSKYYQKGGAKELPEEYAKFLQDMPNGSILVAFGTTFQPTEQIMR